jgi:hypothetical protein
VSQAIVEIERFCAFSLILTTDEVSVSIIGVLMEKKNYFFVLGQYTLTTLLLRWAKFHYERYLTDQRSNVKVNENEWRNLSVAIILSVVALEAFLNEMSFIALNRKSKLFDENEKLTLMGKKSRGKKYSLIHDRLFRFLKIKSKKWRYLSVEEKLTGVVTIVTGKDFPKGGDGSFLGDLNILIGCRNRLVHYRSKKSLPKILSDASDIAIDVIPSIFCEIAGKCNSDPSQVVKKVVSEIGKLGYSLPDSTKRALSFI